MNPTIEQQLIKVIRVLAEDKQQKILEYAEQISHSETADNGEPPKKRKFLERIEEIMSELPKEAYEGYPTDGSLNHDHYLYGAPKREQK